MSNLKSELLALCEGASTVAKIKGTDGRLYKTAEFGGVPLEYGRKGLAAFVAKQGFTDLSVKEEHEKKGTSHQEYYPHVPCGYVAGMIDDAFKAKGKGKSKPAEVPVPIAERSETDSTLFASNGTH